MKDITDEILRVELTNEKRKSATINGVDVTVPDEVIKMLISDIKYYEVNNIKDIDDNYEKLSEKRRIPFKFMQWVMKNHNGLLKNERMLKDAHKAVHDNPEIDYLKEKFPLKDKVQLKVLPSSTLYIHGMRLENIQTINNTAFRGFLFDIVDNSGNRIQGIHTYDSAAEQIMTFTDRSLNDSQDRLNEIKNNINPRPFIIVGTVMKGVRRLHVIRIQDGGRTVPPEIPLIRL